MGLTKPRAAQIFNLDYKQSTRVVTTTNITLSGGAPSLVDGVSLSLGDRVLVIAQTAGTQNGLYYVTTVGSGANGTWARTSDGNENGEIEAGMIVMVTEGTIYADTQWKLITDDPIIINTTALTFTQNYMANSISSGTSNVVVNSNANVTISSAGTANVLTVSSTGTVTTGTASITGNVTGGNVLTAGQVSATGNLSGNYLLANIAFATGYTASKIYNGTSEANIGASGGNANISIGGTSNVVVFATTGEYVTGLLSVTGNVTANNLSATNITGTLSTASQTNITGVGNIISGTWSANTVGIAYGGTGATTAPAAFTNLNGLTITTASATPLVLTNTSTLQQQITGSTSQTITLPSTATLAVGWSFLITNGTGFTVTVQTSTGAVVYSNSNIGTYRVWVISTANNNFTSWSAGVTLFSFETGLGSVVRAVSPTLTTPNIGAATGTSVSVTGTTTAASVVGGVITGTSLSTSGNVTGGNILTGGSISATSNITGGNISATTHTGTTVSVTANVTGGNINTAGNISATGNIAGNYLLANIYYATGFSASRIFNGTSEANISTSGGNANISIGGTSNVAVFATSGAYFNGNLVPAVSNTYSLGSSTNRWANLWLTGNTIYLGNAIITSADSGDIIIDSSGSFAVPVGSTAERSEVIGAIRYNTTVGAFETFDGAGWNTLAYGTQTDFPFGDYGSVSDAATTDAFGVSIAATFDCNAEGPFSYTNLADGEAYVGA